MVAFSWPIGLLLAAAMTAALAALWRLGSILFRHWQEAVVKEGPGSAKPLRLGSMQIMGSGWLLELRKLGNRAALWMWRFVLLLAWPFLLALVLPGGDVLLDAAWSFFTASARGLGAGFVAFLPNLANIVLLVVVFRILLGAVRWMFEEIRKGRIRLPKFDKSWARQTYGLVRMAIVILVAILIFPLLPGSGTSGFQGIAIFVGALVSLGASSAIGNAVAGIVLTYTRGFDRGDRVRIHDITGDVIERTLFVTRVRTIKNEEIAIPNQLVMAGPMTNYSADAGGNGVAVEVRIGLGYEVPWREVHSLLKQAAKQEGVLADPEPRIFQEELGDFAVSYTLHAFVADPRVMVAIRSKLIERVLDLFGEAGIEITSPEHLALRDAAPPLARPFAKRSTLAGASSAKPVEPDVPEDTTASPPEPGDEPIGGTKGPEPAG